MCWKRWFLGICIAHISALALIIAFNCAIDDGMIINPSLLRDAAVKINEGKIVAGLPNNFDYGIFQEELIKTRREIPYVVALGSCRIMGLRKSDLNIQKPFLNSGIGGSAYLKDFIAISEIYISSGKIPHILIICIDPWFFTTSTIRFDSLRGYYNDAISKMNYRIGTVRIGFPSLNIEGLMRYKSLLSLNYTLLNFNQFIKKQKRNSYYLVSNTDVDDFVKDCDGTHYWPYSDRYRPDEDVRELAHRWQVMSITPREFSKLSNIKLFEQYINWLESYGIEVVFLITPAHPIVYENSLKYGANSEIMQTENYIRNFSKTNHIRVYGSFDPNRLGLSSKDFSAPLHPHYSWVFPRIFENF